MMTKGKLKKLYSDLKTYNKKFLNNKITELDESGTRLMINSFLTDVLGFTPIDEVKTEYMIRGAYADYVIQMKGVKHFLVEVKALSLDLSDKHLRQARQYGADEGIDWALLTNGKKFDFYRILFTKPIESKLVFSIDMSDAANIRTCIEQLQFLHKDSILNKGLDLLWDKCTALDPRNVAGMLYTEPVLNFMKRQLTRKYKHKFTDSEIENAINRVVHEEISIEEINHFKVRKAKRKSGQHLVSQKEITPSGVEAKLEVEMPKPTV